MSTYVVEDETINKIVSFLHSSIQRGYPLSEIGTAEILEAGFNLTTIEGIRQLAEEMFALNVAAVNARYGKGEAEKFRPLDFKFRFVSVFQIPAIKSLDSWLYQCSEGNIPATRIYQAMEDVRSALCIDSVHRTEEYEAAPWG